MVCWESLLWSDEMVFIVFIVELLVLFGVGVKIAEVLLPVLDADLFDSWRSGWLIVWVYLLIAWGCRVFGFFSVRFFMVLFFALSIGLVSFSIDFLDFLFHLFDQFLKSFPPLLSFHFKLFSHFIRHSFIDIFQDLKHTGTFLCAAVENLLLFLVVGKVQFWVNFINEVILVPSDPIALVTHNHNLAFFSESLLSFIFLFCVIEWV